MNKKNKGKKNLKRPIILSALIALLTLIGITGSTTYAKYISNKTIPSQTATVAKWGYIVSADATNLFGEKHGTENLATTVSDSGKLVVSSTAGQNVLAPGTAGYLTLKVEGSSEVMSKVTFDTESTLPIKEICLRDGTDASANEYYPVKWSLQKKESSTDDFSYVTDGYGNSLQDTKLDSIITILSGIEYNLEASPVSDVYIEYRLSYSWAFDGQTTTLKTDKAGVNLSGDEADTLLGAFAVNPSYETGTTTVYKADVETSFTVGITVAQVQSFM